MDFDAVDRVALGDGIDNILSFRHFAEHGVFTVQPGSGGMGNKELGSVGAGSGISHGKDAGSVVEEVAAEFVFKLVAGATHACTGRVAALNHEVGDDAVEGNTVIEALGGQVQEGCRRDGSLGGEYGQFDIALGGFDGDVFVCSHAGIIDRER